MRVWYVCYLSTNTDVEQTMKNMKDVRSSNSSCNPSALPALVISERSIIIFSFSGAEKVGIFTFENLF